MGLFYVMVLACVMVLTHVMVLTRVMVLASVVTFVWVTRPGRPKGAANAVKRLEGPPARIWALKGP